MLQQAPLTEHDHSLIYSQTIQNGLLPKERHFRKFFTDYFVLHKPQNKIGGDFYWLTTKDDTIYFALADCTGHGISGAMLSVLGISLLNYVIQKNFTNVGDYLTELDKKWIETFNNELHDSHFNNDWMDLTLIAYNKSTKQLQYAAASAEFAILQNNTIEIYKGNNFPIGGWQIEKQRVFATFTLDLEVDSKLFFFSDGIKHQFDSNNAKKFSRKRLLNCISHYHHLPMSHQKELLEFVFDTWKGKTTQTDDVSLIGIQF